MALILSKYGSADSDPAGSQDPMILGALVAGEMNGLGFSPPAVGFGKTCAWWVSLRAVAFALGELDLVGAGLETLPAFGEVFFCFVFFCVF